MIEPGKLDTGVTNLFPGDGPPLNLKIQCANNTHLLLANGDHQGWFNYGYQFNTQTSITKKLCSSISLLEIHISLYLYHWHGYKLQSISAYPAEKYYVWTLATLPSTFEYLPPHILSKTHTSPLLY